MKSLPISARSPNIPRHFTHEHSLDFGDDGCVHVDATQSPVEITTENKEADVTLATSIDTFSKILNGESDPNIAFMMGKLKIRGHGFSLKLNALLEG